jgi:hypothetical protein
MADYKAVEPTTATAPNTEMPDRVLKACSYCGVQTVGAEATACARCGKPFLPPQSDVNVPRQEGRAQMSGALRLCPKCQSQIAEQAVFCAHCGVSVATGRTAVENGIQHNATAPSPPKANTGQNLAVFVVSMFILYFLWTNFGYLLDTSSSQTGYASTTTHSVKYMVDGDSFTNVSTGFVNVTMTNSSGGTEQHTVKTPWEKEFTASNGKFLYLSGQNEYDAGHAYVKIYVDGHLLQSADSHGVASVSGIVK